MTDENTDNSMSLFCIVSGCAMYASAFLWRIFLLTKPTVKIPFKEDEVVASYKSLILRMPRPNQYLLLYVLDLLSVFARKCDKNLMTASSEPLH